MRPAARWRNRATVKLPPECAATADSDALAEGPATSAEVPFNLNVGAVMHELLPGFIHMQGVLPMTTQQSLLEMSCAVAAESRQSGISGGWYRREQDGQWSLNDGNKARFWDDISRFPFGVKELGEGVARLAGHRFPLHLAAPSAAFNARVGALNFYSARGRMGWHVDDTNFAKKERPIVMANLGNAADFGYKMRKGDADRSVRLDSGDVIVFGGPARDLVHALLQVHPQTSPQGLLFPENPGVGRISITWRDVGTEDGLTFNSDERLGLKITEQTLPRYKKAQKQQNAKQQFQWCAQCNATIESSRASRGPAYCAQCWQQWQGS